MSDDARTHTPPGAEPATGANDDTPAPSPEAVAGPERIAALEAEVAALNEKWLRAEAEAQNARNRHRKELEDARNYAVQKFATDVAEAADNLRRGLESLPPAAEGEPELLAKLRGGFEGVERAFLGILERNGVKRVDAAGQPFDPALHQAMAEQPAPPGVAPGTVIQAWTPAWTLNGRLLKPAMVVVAGQPAG
ncbi:nucleotide exchange factor GrpE [Roseomonas sp. OT10]|uniref:nucleotide exchange factor GrpE n=1 Tax=Roseomonas cutis TaxID=2897332 RepID=UPI001E52A727|nr:nucleotide exchange factor GrpE [Roseomonas sp. OT10]UFN47134.1 nucleotide exchange factor GrpE [Roseomonas sp. OT10]